MSNKASALGSGSSFARAQNISPRRAAINAAAAAPTEGAPPPVKLPVNLISLNPANPRSSLGDLADLAGSMRDHGQKTAISIMSRFSYLEAHPGKEGDLEKGTKYVAIDGNSRLAAAREAGIEEVKVMLDDDLGADSDEVLESALVANIHRNDLDHLDEAEVLKQLLKKHGTQAALAARLHRSQGWVAQRLALLGLTPELKEALVSGKESAELLRRVGNKKPEEQNEHLKRLKEEQTEEEEAKKRRTVDRAAKKKRASPAVPNQQTAKPSDDQRTTNAPPAAQTSESRPSPGESAPERPAEPVTITAETWNDPAVVKDMMAEHMTVENRQILRQLIAADPEWA
ncbi:ParB/RepB/Spo0J family partition protein [Streptomyces sp. NPDC060366]|uniref:ParB/RepB/Spo0J family partition protein n=1 Tax=Streptomyces sp. NPDC060366 TaxID=3347105 RepID=UPI0036469A99